MNPARARGVRAAATAVLLAVGIPVPGVAQRGAPLLKTDLIELLSSPVIADREIADLVRRNCLAFRPTERDLVDLQRLGASAEVVESVTACARSPMPRPGDTAARPPATLGGAPALPAAPVTPPAAGVNPAATQVVLRQSRIVAAAGSDARIVVLAAVRGIPQRNVPIALRGSGRIDGASGRDITVTTDDSGFAVIPVGVGRRLGVYRLEVAPPAPAGATFPGRPVVEVVVRPGPAASAYVEPREVVFDQGLDSIVPVTVAVRDSVGHPIGGETVLLGGNPEGAAFLPDTARTDSLGRAVLFVARGSAARGGTLQVRVAGRQLAWVDVVLGMPLLSGGTGFLTPPTLSGVVGQELGAPVVFEARTRLGQPAAGRTVIFRALGATVSPASAVTDSTGRARVEVVLGNRVGPALVVARVDSIEKQLTLQVDPGPATELVLEHNGSRVNGRWLIVGLDTTFVVRVEARDVYGNVTGVANLARMLRETPFNAMIPIARLLSVQEEPTGVALTFLAIRPGRANVKLRATDVAAAVWLEVVAVR